MFLEQRQHMFFPAQFALPAAGCLGTVQKWPIDRTYPIEEIVLTVNFTVTTALTLATALNTPDNVDNILTILQHVNLSVNDGKQPRSVVDCNGVALLEAAIFCGLNNDYSTNLLTAQSKGATIAANSSYRITYRIPCAEPWIGEPLRSRLYLPVHTYPQDPVLTLTFNSLANITTGSGAITNLTTEVVLLRRVPTASSEALLQKSAGTNPNGYIDWDLIETPFSVAPGIGTEQRFPLPIPGEYSWLMFRQYLGGANLSRSVLDSSGIGDTIGRGFTNETRWRLETAQVVYREWRWKHLQSINDMSRVHFAFGGSVGTPAFADGDKITATNFRPASSTFINFVADGIGGDTGVELGSLLDCNTPANNGLKMEIVGTPFNVATNASYMYVMGRRFFGDLSKWQKFV